MNESVHRKAERKIKKRRAINAKQAANIQIQIWLLVCLIPFFSLLLLIFFFFFDYYSAINLQCIIVPGKRDRCIAVCTNRYRKRGKCKNVNVKHEIKYTIWFDNIIIMLNIYMVVNLKYLWNQCWFFLLLLFFSSYFYFGLLCIRIWNDGLRVCSTYANLQLL